MTPSDLQSLYSAISAGESATYALRDACDAIRDIAEAAAINHPRFAIYRMKRTNASGWFNAPESVPFVFRMEGSIDSVEVTPPMLYVRLRERGYKGDGDSFNTVAFPQQWMTMDKAALTELFMGMLDTFMVDEDEKGRIAAARQLEADKAQLAALQAKLGPDYWTP